MSDPARPSNKDQSPGRGEPEILARTDRLIASLLKHDSDDRGAFAGAVLLVSREGDVIKHEAYGHAELFDERGERLEGPRPMRRDSVFDLASITKAAVTANLLALLFERGAVRPSDPVASVLPAFDRPDKREICIADLLMHTSGLAAWLPFYLFIDSPDEASDLIAELPLRRTRGRFREYSDINFILLGRLIEEVGGQRLDSLFEEWIARPLGLARTRYLPPGKWRENIVATSMGNDFEERMCAERSLPLEPKRGPRDLPGWRDHVMVGEVNDGNCHLAFGGVAGHAGLFSTAADLARLGTALLGALQGERGHLLRPETANYFTTPKVTPGQGLGWWTNRLDVAPRTFGHRGFTGTQLFVDPGNDLITVLLTNRVHGSLPYAEAASFTDPIMSSIYRDLRIAEELRVDPWLG